MDLDGNERGGHGGTDGSSCVVTGIPTQSSDPLLFLNPRSPYGSTIRLRHTGEVGGVTSCVS